MLLRRKHGTYDTNHRTADSRSRGHHLFNLWPAHWSHRSPRQTNTVAVCVLIMKLTRRTLLKAPLALAAPASKTERPNLLFLIADDHARSVMGCDGNRTAKTPNIDRLSAEGVRFARNYCNSPVCTPSRQCILTGQMPHSAGVTLLATPLSEDKPTSRQCQKSCDNFAPVVKHQLQL